MTPVYPGALTPKQLHRRAVQRIVFFLQVAGLGMLFMAFAMVLLAWNNSASVSEFLEILGHAFS